MLLKKIYTLVFLRRNDKVLLGMKKRGFGINKWNGFGGKVEPQEPILDAAVRELKEECCVIVEKENLKPVGQLEFTFDEDTLFMDVRVFTACIFSGQPQETEEMAPKWFNTDNIPFAEMWPDDKYWFPYMLKEKCFYGRFHYKGHDTILNYNLCEVPPLKGYE